MQLVLPPSVLLICVLHLFLLQVRNKQVYLQYSTRNEIVNSGLADSAPGHVLLLMLDNLAPETTITINNLYLLFSAFGTVQKIATFEKAGSYQVSPGPAAAPAEQHAGQMDSAAALLAVPAAAHVSQCPCPEAHPPLASQACASSTP